jgi:hypothetical protein
MDVTLLTRAWPSTMSTRRAGQPPERDTVIVPPSM